MIIDCHGHYTTEPKDLHRFRKEQTEAVKNKSALPARRAKMSDDEIRVSTRCAAAPASAAPTSRSSAARHGPPYRRFVSHEWTQICNV